MRAAFLPRVILIAGCLMSLGACSLVRPPTVVTTAAAVPLLDTHWRLVQLGAQLVDNPPGAGEAHIVLGSTNNAVTGNGGCNRFFGHYALENDMLKFDGLGGTKMFCEGRMPLEQSLTNALLSTLTWKITGRSLELRDETGSAVATFEAGG